MTYQPDMDQLMNFFGGYFNQDWTVEADDADAVLEQFFREGWTAEELQGLSKELECYLGSRSDQELQVGLYAELGCYYDPTADGLDVRAWLEDVAAALRAKAQAGAT